MPLDLLHYSCLPPELAITYCNDLFNQLIANPKELGLTPSRGHMFGVLVCKTPCKEVLSPETQSSETIVLKAFSGQMHSKWLVEGWIPPSLDVEEFDKHVAETGEAIKSLTDEILSLSDSTKTAATGSAKKAMADSAKKATSNQESSPENTAYIKSLKKRRRQLSHESLKVIYEMYNFTDLQGNKFGYKDIAESFFYDKQRILEVPTGVGECCGPKLLSYAYSKGYTPISMAEFFVDFTKIGDGTNASDFPKTGDGTKADNSTNTADFTNAGDGTNTEDIIKLKQTAPEFFPPCREKCAYVLPLINGIDIIYRDEYLVVVNKPSGVLSVPGRGPDKQDCLVNRLKAFIPTCMEQPSVHRLDMETSGLMVFALDKETHKNLSRQFQEGRVSKQYEALLEGSLFKSTGESAVTSVSAYIQGCENENENNNENNEKIEVTKTSNKNAIYNTSKTYNTSKNAVNHLGGVIELPFRLDVDNRPYQIYDDKQGKWGKTVWKAMGEEIYKGRKVTRVHFEPHTGRTHQLRLHSSHQKGLGLPIVGDVLYGNVLEPKFCKKTNTLVPVKIKKIAFGDVILSTEDFDRMMLHAKKLTFYHPATGEQVTFELPAPF